MVAPQVPALGDASAYHLLAERLAHGGGYIRPFDDLLLHLRRPTAEYPPLFPVLLSLPARLGAHSVEQQRIFMAFVGAGTVALVGLLGRRVASDAVGLDRGGAGRGVSDALPERGDPHGRVAVRRARDARSCSARTAPTTIRSRRASSRSARRSASPR